MVTLFLFFTLVLRANETGKAYERIIVEPLPDTFNWMESHPHLSKGVIEFIYENKKKIISLDDGSSFLIRGFVLKPNLLPVTYRKQIGSSKKILQTMIIQSGKNTVVGSFQLIAPHFFFQKRDFLIKHEMKKTSQFEAFFQILNPELKDDSPPDEKLKQTWFSQDGKLSFQFLGLPTRTTMQIGQSSIALKIQKAKLSLNCSLTTPFNTQKAELKGDFEMPVVWSDQVTSDKKLVELFAQAPKAATLLKPAGSKKD